MDIAFAVYLIGMGVAIPPATWMLFARRNDPNFQKYVGEYLQFILLWPLVLLYLVYLAITED